jgi:hypothetical protein
MATYEVIYPDGTHRTQNCRAHNFRGFGQRYDRIAGLLSKDELHSGMVLAALTYIVEAQPMWEKALDAYRRDPIYFVEPLPAH